MAMKESNIPYREQTFSGVRLVDCHAHLEELKEPEAAIERAGRSGVEIGQPQRGRGWLGAFLTFTGP
jgi:hypothetical protein